MQAFFYSPVVRIRMEWSHLRGWGVGGGGVGWSWPHILKCAPYVPSLGNPLTRFEFGVHSQKELDSVLFTALLVLGLLDHRGGHSRLPLP